MADKLNITRSFYGMIETGDRNPTLPLARKIAELLDSDIETLFFDQHQNGAKECEDKGIMSKNGVKRIRCKKNRQT
jgi:DNA-binding XRE family transcriptional regulator